MGVNMASASGWQRVFVGGLLAFVLSCQGDDDKLTVVGQPLLDDKDGDGVIDEEDNCPEMENADQVDADLDAIGDVCDPLVDADIDGIADELDTCKGLANPDQTDGDADGVGDLCDNCPAAFNADQLDDDADGIGNACPCDACDPGQWCQLHPDAAAWPTACLDSCPDELQGQGGLCCPLGSRFSAETGSCLLPDIYVDVERLEGSLVIEEKVIEPGSCELYEGCVGGPGPRRLLRFDTTTPNIGQGDMYLGRPEEREDIFLFSECHSHYHLDTYADYQLLDAEGLPVAPGHKQAFCLMDYEPWAPEMGWRDARYHCGNQGISAGFADTYSSDLDCQYVDITDVPPGQYTLRIALNYEHLLAESDYSNDVAEITVNIPAP